MSEIIIPDGVKPPEPEKTWRATSYQRRLTESKTRQRQWICNETGERGWFDLDKPPKKGKP